MGRKSKHTGLELFDYLNGRLDEQAAQKVEHHLADCDDCSSLAALVRGLKSEAQGERFDLSARHPDTGQLAVFFYGRSQGARSAAIAAHIALCQSCAEEIALYARAEQAASVYDSSKRHTGQVPETAWKMIRDWRESSFARPKPDSERASPQVLSQRKDELRELASRALKRGEAEKDAEKAGLVPVIIVDGSARFRGVEMFERSTGPHGSSVLKHPEKSHRFDNMQFHALLDFGEQSFVVISDFIKRDKVRLQQVTSPDGRLRRADYFIVED